MALSTRDRSLLRSLGKAGDIIARAANEAMSVSNASLIAGGTNLAAKSATRITAAVAASGANVYTIAAQPQNPRNLSVTSSNTGWDGGNITIVGTDQFDRPQSEVITPPATATVVYGTKIFKTVTSVTKATVGASGTTASVGTGDKIGITTRPATGSPVLLAANGVGEAVTFDATNVAFTPTTVPNGSTSYVLTANV